MSIINAKQAVLSVIAKSEAGFDFEQGKALLDSISWVWWPGVGRKLVEKMDREGLTQLRSWVIAERIPPGTELAVIRIIDRELEIPELVA